MSLFIVFKIFGCYCGQQLLLCGQFSLLSLYEKNIIFLCEKLHASRTQRKYTGLSVRGENLNFFSACVKSYILKRSDISHVNNTDLNLLSLTLQSFYVKHVNTCHETTTSFLFNNSHRKMYLNWITCISKAKRASCKLIRILCVAFILTSMSQQICGQSTIWNNRKKASSWNSILPMMILVLHWKISNRF